MAEVTTAAPTSVRCGYDSSIYAGSLSGFGRPRELQASGGWIVERGIPGTGLQDAMGCYPLFSCTDWSRLSEDLEQVEGGLVSLSVVPDPLAGQPVELLRACFPDHFVPFKPHFVVDLSLPPEEFVKRDHLRKARRAYERVEVRALGSPIEALDRFTRLYENLVRRHGIEGPRSFSRSAFDRQLSVPGIVAFEATTEGESVGMLLWFVRGDVAYYHLGAYDDRGYELGASYALFHHALGCFADSGLRELTLGGGAGLGRDGGLSRFKRGWSTGTRQAYFCGRILDPERYAELSACHTSDGYFPAYRRGEFR